MEKFSVLTAKMVALPVENIDTDQIIPARFLTTTEREGLGRSAFFDWRGTGTALDDPRAKDAALLVAGSNFGCGSSREHAPWALADYGIQVMIAPSFADIFYNNCFKNGILPIVMPQDVMDVLMEDAEKGANARMTVDLEAQEITTSDGEVIKFDVDAFKKHCLLNGLDDIGLTFEKSAHIDTFENKRKATQPWL